MEEREEMASSQCRLGEGGKEEGGGTDEKEIIRQNPIGRSSGQWEPLCTKNVKNSRVLCQGCQGSQGCQGETGREREFFT